MIFTNIDVIKCASFSDSDADSGIIQGLRGHGSVSSNDDDGDSVSRYELYISMITNLFMDL